MTAESEDPVTGRRAILDGVKVVEFAHLIAGPLAGTFLADLGAEVIHVESPTTGDAARRMGPAKDSVHIWWKVSGRNKRSVTLDLHAPEGQAVAQRLAGWADVVITNFRIETLERWGLDWETLHRRYPKLIVLHVSANGLTSAQRNAPGFGKVGEARSGVVHLTGFADGPPVHTGFSHADSITGLMGAFGISAALTRRHEADFEGELIDIALFEPLFRLVEWQVIAHDQLDVVPTRSGNQLAISPASVVNTYAAADGVWITVTSATQRSVLKVVELVGEPSELYDTVAKQSERRQLLDAKLRAWIGQRSSEECLRRMAELEVVASRIYDVADICADEVFREREAIVTVHDDDLGPVRMQAVIPKLHQHPGTVRHTAPALGADNDLVYGKYLAIPEIERAALASAGVI